MSYSLLTAVLEGFLFSGRNVFFKRNIVHRVQGTDLQFMFLNSDKCICHLANNLVKCGSSHHPSVVPRPLKAMTVLNSITNHFANSWTSHVWEHMVRTLQGLVPTFLLMSCLRFTHISTHISSQTFSRCWEYEWNCMSLTTHSSILPLMDIWIASFQFCLLQVKLQQPLLLYTCVCVGRGGWMLLLSLGNYWGVELLRNTRFTAQITTIQISKALPLATDESFCSSTPSPAFGVFRPF